MNNCFPVVQDFCPYYLGDAWTPSNAEFGPIRVKDSGADWLAGIVSARMQLRIDQTGAVAFELSTSPIAGQGLLVLAQKNLEGGTYRVVQLPPQGLPVPVNRNLLGRAGSINLRYDLEVFWSAGGLPRTIFRGVMPVMGDVTHD